MLRIHFTSEDLRRVTVADGVDPLWEILLSLHLLQERDTCVEFDQWRRRINSTRSASLRLLAQLAPPWGYSPDFLTPGRGDAEFEVLLDRLLSTPRRRLGADIEALAETGPVSTWVRAIGSGETGALRRLEAAFTTYHRLALAPHRDAFRAQAEADRTRRAQMLLAGGVDRLLGSLHPRVKWEPPVLRIPVYMHQDVHLRGRGIVLVPSFFCRIQPITLLDAKRPPVLVYPLAPRLGLFRGAALARESTSPTVALLGGTRAAVLEAAAAGGSTRELARRVGVADPVVSRHCGVLRAAGLLETRRCGGSVWHGPTGLGIALLNGELPDGRTAPLPAEAKAGPEFPARPQ
ncbi:winged helix-turn-helix domain-containing protein [Micromonospora sp. NPDC023888]|uniref:ArsR/SmtB family transcription factor n=1 Tax=Micromonospora sp. NPDC023888 TaxID=3155607 RepID=UPI0033E12C8A